MNLDRVTPGKNIPDEINVIIEIPAHSDPVKYEVDKETGAMFVDRFMNTAMHYPCNYGYVPHTLSEDGDPVDVLVITPIPLISGSVISCRPISMMKMTDESGPDAKVLAVPIDRLATHYRHIQTMQDLRSSCSTRFHISSITTKTSRLTSGSRLKAGKIARPPTGKSSPVSSATTMLRSNPVSD